VRKPQCGSVTCRSSECCRDRVASQLRLNHCCIKTILRQTADNIDIGSPIEARWEFCKLRANPVIYGALSRSTPRRRWGRPDRSNLVKGAKRGAKLHVLIDRTGCRWPWPVSTATPMKPGADPTGGGDCGDPLDAGPRRRRPASGPLLTTALFLPYSSNMAERVVYAKEWL
jgi:hypothetical protein